MSDRPSTELDQSGGSQFQLAGWWVRLGARLVDLAIYFLTATLLVLWGGSTIFREVEDDVFPLAALVLPLMIWFLVNFLAEWAMVARWGRTVGKIIFGIGVVSADPNRTVRGMVSFRRSLVVAGVGIIPWLGWLALLLVYISGLNNDNRQGWHDRFADTLVVKQGN